LVLENAWCQSLDRIAQLEPKVNELAARLNRHSYGKSAATVRSPRGGSGVLRLVNLQVSAKDQNDAGLRI
jgi:hypothetical protein